MASRTSVALAVLVLAGCQRDPDRAPPTAARSRPAAVEKTAWFEPQALGAAFEGRPWITHVTAVDLDRDGLIDVLACDAKANTVVWIRQAERGRFIESAVAASIPAPVHVEAADMNGDGYLDLLVASMGQVFPNNDQIGSVIILENDGRQKFTPHVVAEHIARVTDVRAGDFNADGKPDLAVGQFGYHQGEIRWMENRGGWQFTSHNLLDLSGTVNVGVGDLNGDGTVDIVALVSQEWEEIYLFENDGRGNFTRKVIYGSTNEDFGSSGISLCDLNRDGRIDILYTNGDGFDYAEPGSRPWHGVQWLENRGDGMFKYRRVGTLAGAYSPVGVDLDGDGYLDIVATSGFNEWKNPGAVSLAVFRNDGRMNFTEEILARAPTHLVTCAAADFDGTGAPVIVTGGFHAYPPWDRMSRLTIWRQTPKR